MPSQKPCNSLARKPACKALQAPVYAHAYAAYTGSRASDFKTETGCTQALTQAFNVSTARLRTRRRTDAQTQDAQTRRRTDAPQRTQTHRCTHEQTHKRATDNSTRTHANAQARRRANAQTLRHASAKTLTDAQRRTHASNHRRANAQTRRSTDAPTRALTRAQADTSAHRCTREMCSRQHRPRSKASLPRA